MTRYEGFSTGFGFGVYRDGKVFDPGPSQKVRNHSPDGFAWGYLGSGPAQLALALLLDALGEKERAVGLYQDFKSGVVAGWGQDWTITDEEIGAVCRELESKYADRRVRGE